MSTNLKPSLFDVEELQQLSYERSKKWAIFLNTICENEQENPINIDEIDVLYPDVEEDQSELASMEDENYEDEPVDSEVLKDITNSSHNRLTSTKLSDSTMMNKDTTEIVDLFNQTLPVINEHNRQLKDFGLERILNTFDAKKIEEKVGGWLKRHNSLCITKDNKGHSLDYLQYQKKECQPKAMKNFFKHGVDNSDSDSDDSFRSGETARYIRKVGAIKNSSSPTTMIKTYRTIERSRQALKEKYACAQDYEAEFLHLKRLRHHRQHSLQSHVMRSNKVKQTLYKTPSQITHSSRRRKVLRKRSTSNSFSARDTTSDSDSSYCNGSKEKLYCRERNCYGQYCRATAGGYGPLTSIKRYQHRQPVPTIPLSIAASAKRSQYRHTGRRAYRSYHFSYGNSETSVTSSPSSSPSGPFTCRRKVLRRHNEKRSREFDYKYNSGNDHKMCQEYKHIANTSSGEWVVEETFISKKIHIEPNAEIMENDNITVQENANDEVKLDTPKPLKNPKTRKEKSVAMKKLNSHKSNSSMDATDKSFEEQLKLAIEESKKMYEKELLKSQEKTGKKQRQTLPHKPLVKKVSQRKRNLFEEIEENTIEDIKEKSHKKRNSSEYEKNTSLIIETSLIPNTTQRNSTIEGGSEETFFAASGKVCNSTALPNNKSACKREIESDLNLQTSTMLSSTNLEVKQNTSSSKPVKQRLKNISKSQSMDNSIVEDKTPQSRKLKKSERNAVKEDDDNLFIKPNGKPKKRALQKSKSMPENENTKDEKICKQEAKGRKSSNSKKSRKSLEPKEPTNETEKHSTLKTEGDKMIIDQQNIPFIKEEINSFLDQKSSDDDYEKQNQQEYLKFPSDIITDNPNISSTTKNSSDLNKSQRISTKSLIEVSSEDDGNDCTVVSSTTNIEPPSNPLQPVAPMQQDEASVFRNYCNYNSRKAILIYTPNNPSPNIPLSNDGCFVHISKDHLSSVIGEKPAEKFLKYYIGRRRFPKNSWVYFKPPADKMQDTNGSSSSDSDLDDLDRIGKYGALYASDGGGDGSNANDCEKP